MNRNLAVVGSPISHSKSPVIHSSAYRILNLDWQYSKLEIRKNHLMQFVETLDESWIGLSVTAPLKEEAMNIASAHDSSTELPGVANTLVKANSGWQAFNTDVFGIQRAVAGLVEIDRIAILGSGATAKSALVALGLSFPKAKFLICGRNSETLNELTDLTSKMGMNSKTSKSFRKGLTSSDLVVSTLPANALDDHVQKLAKSRFYKPSGVLFDVAYDPWPSSAASLWLENSLPVISGIEMLLWQAVGQIRVFTGGSLDLELPNEAAVMLAMRHSIGLI